MEKLLILLNDWVLLNKSLNSLTEKELQTLINYECSTKKRWSYIERMHQRYAKLTTIRIRDDLMNGGLL